MSIVVVLVVTGEVLGELLGDSHDRVTAFRESSVELSSLLIAHKLSSRALFLRQLNRLSAVPKRCPDAHLADLLGLRTQAQNVAEEWVCHSGREKYHR